MTNYRTRKTIQKYAPLGFWIVVVLFLTYSFTEHQTCTYVIVNHVALVTNCHQVPFWSHAPLIAPGR